MKRALSLFAAVIALWPSIALAADVSDPASLRAILPDPADVTWLEAVQGQSGFLEGPLTYDSITAYYAYYQQSASFIDAEIRILKDNGYSGGYERSWYRHNSRDQLAERVSVFASAAKAKSAQASFKSFNDGNGVVSSYFDPQMGADAYGWFRDQTSYHFAEASFVKGDAVYIVETGSAKSLKADDVMPQARSLFAAAPPNIGLPAPPQSPLVRFRLPLLITFVSGAVLIAVALVIAVVSAIDARPVQPAPRQA